MMKTFINSAGLLTEVKARRSRVRRVECKASITVSYVWVNINGKSQGVRGKQQHAIMVKELLASTEGNEAKCRATRER